MSIKFTHSDQEFLVGDSVRVNYIIKEKGDKERFQAFDGIILSIKGRGDNKNFVVSKNASDAVKVERIFDIKSPWIGSILKLRGPKRRVRRAKLYYLRDERARTL
jgi:large subunit ribosomal protein L19